ncbi:MAG: hypothetical protein Q6373_003360 [Candidatus Sigynarchaeota archaeon]
MARSQRRVNAYGGAIHDVSTSGYKCSECKGKLVHTRGITYICTRCGLVQHVEKTSVDEEKP